MSDPIELEDFELVDTDEVARLTLANEKAPPDVDRIKTWLRPTDYLAPSSEFQRHLASKAPDTGKWIQELDQYRKWHDSQGAGFLWIKGVPGAGKSVVAASLVDLLAQESAPVLYFFFREIIATNRTGRSLTCDWLCQLLPFSQILQVLLWMHVQRDAELADMATNQLWKYLLTALRSVDKAYCIIDALDEMDIEHEFFSTVNSLGLFRPGHVKVLVTSRPKQYLQRALKNPAVVHVSLEEERVSRDIQRFVEHRTRSLGVAEDIRNSAVEIVSQRSQGLFLYARLMLDELATADPATLAEHLARLPLGLEEMYNNILFERSISTGVDELVQFQILQLVTQAARPLRLIEIAKVVETNKLVSGGGKEIVRTACGPLLEIMEDEVVQVLHHSFTEFLRDTRRSRPGHQFPVIDPNQAHYDIATLCLEYLMGPIFEHYVPPGDNTEERPSASRRRRRDDAPPSNVQTTLLQYPFAQYAAEQWTYHARLDGGSKDLLQTVILFSEGRCYAGWSDLTGSGPSKRSPLHAAASSGLLFWVQHLIDDGAELDARDLAEHTPTMLAAGHGYEDIVALLIRSGANPDLDSCEGWKPMHYAALRNHARVAGVLLSAGVSPVTPRPRHRRGWCGNEPSRVGEHPLQYASQAGNTKVVVEMLPYLQAQQLEDALCWAAGHGHTDLMRALFEQSDVSPNAELRVNRDLILPGTALLLACEAVEPQCVELLLERGADVNRVFTLRHKHIHLGGGPRERNSETALHVLIDRVSEQRKDGWQSIFHMLLAHGADLEAKDGDGKTPFLRAFGRYRALTDVLKVLQQAGANLCAVDNKGESALIHAAQGYDEELVRYLLQWNDATLADPKGHTPLHYAVSSGIRPIGIVQALVSAGAYVNAINKDGDAPLHLLYRDDAHRALEITRCLLENGADVDTPNKLGQSCLYTYKCSTNQESRREEDAAVLGLVVPKAQLNQTDNQGRTVLQYAIIENAALLDPLLRLSSQPILSIRTHGKSVLHIACQANDTEPKAARIVKLLLDSGAQVTVDDEGNTLLHEVATRFQGSEDDVALLEEILKIVPMEARNSKGQTALHVVPRFRPERKYGQQSLADLLKKRNPQIDVDAVDDDRNTPLHLTVQSEFLAYSLILQGANVNARNGLSQTPLHLAARGGKGGVVAMLLHYSAASSADTNGSTPLLEACGVGCADAGAALIAAGLEPTPDCITEAKACKAVDSEADPSEVAKILTGAHMDPVDSDQTRLDPDVISSIVRQSKEDFDSREGRPMLHTRIPCLTVSELEKLLEHGVDFTRALSMRTTGQYFSETTLGLVARSGRRDLMAKLISQAIACDNAEYRTSRCTASYVNPIVYEACTRPTHNLEMINFLLSHGLDVNATRSLSGNREPTRGKTALHILARGDYWWQIDAIKFLVDSGQYFSLPLATANVSGAHLESKDEQGRTPLHIASEGPEDQTDLAVMPGTFRKQCCRALLALGADPNSLDDKKVSPLDLTHDFEIITLLIEHGGDMNLGERGVVMAAIEAKDLELLKFYLKHGADCNTPDTSGAHHGRPYQSYPVAKVVGGLRSNYDWKPRANPELLDAMLETLLDHGAKLDISLDKGAILINELLRESEPACLVPLFRKAYFDPGLRDGKGCTPFLSACDSGRDLDGTPAFVQLGRSEHYQQDFTAVDHNGQNMLMYLLSRWNEHVPHMHEKHLDSFVKPVLPQLLAQRDKDGYTSLHHAVKARKQNASWYFVNSGAKIGDATSDGDTVLHLCCRNSESGEGYLAPWAWLMETFLRKEGSIDVRNNRGETPLHAYVSGVRDPSYYFLDDFISQHEYVDFLASHGADLFAKDNRGQTVLHHIAARDSLDYPGAPNTQDYSLQLFKQLAERGCDPLTEDNDGRTALDVAAFSGNAKILESYHRTKA